MNLSKIYSLIKINVTINRNCLVHYGGIFIKSILIYQIYYQNIVTNANIKKIEIE
jgi:hypothetical protein